MHKSTHRRVYGEPGRPTENVEARYPEVLTSDFGDKRVGYRAVLRLDPLDLRLSVWMERGVDGTRVPPSVDSGGFPRAPADTAEAPSARTAVSFRERSGAARAGAAASCQLVYSECVVEHLFERMLARVR